MLSIARQHTRTALAVGIYRLLLRRFSAFCEDEKLYGMLKEMDDLLTACAEKLPERRLSVGGRRHIDRASAEVATRCLTFIAEGSDEAFFKWCSLFCAADLIFNSCFVYCPAFAKGPAWKEFHDLSDKCIDAMMTLCPGCDEAGDDIYDTIHSII